MAENSFGVGCRYLRVALLKTEPDSAIPTYDAVLAIGDTNAINATRNTTNATADGDDHQVANITMTTGMSLEWTGWGVPAATSAAIYGHEIDEDTSELKESMDDLAPYVGVGYIRTMADKTNKRSYEAYFYYKAQAVQGDEEATSAGSDMNLASTKVTFNAVQPTYGPMRSIKTFTDEAEAKKWIDGIIAPTT